MRWESYKSDCDGWYYANIYDGQRMLETVGPCSSFEDVEALAHGIVTMELEEGYKPAG